MARNASNLYPHHVPFVPSVQPPFQGNTFPTNMGLGGIQQIPVGSMTSDPRSQFPGYSVPPTMNTPLPINAPSVANLGYGSFPSGGGYNTPSPSVKYPGQQGYPSYYATSEGISNRQKDSWGMPPPYTVAEPVSKEEEPPNTYSSSRLASPYDTWNRSPNDLSKINKDIHKKRKSRSRSKSKESRKSHKKKSKRRSKSPDSLSSRGNKKYRYSRSPTDYRKDGDERTMLLIDPNRIPTPPPPPILRGYDNSVEKINESKSTSSKTLRKKNRTPPAECGEPQNKEMADITVRPALTLTESLQEIIRTVKNIKTDIYSGDCTGGYSVAADSLLFTHSQHLKMKTSFSALIFLLGLLQFSVGAYIELPDDLASPYEGLQRERRQVSLDGGMGRHHGFVQGSTGSRTLFQNDKTKIDGTLSGGAQWQKGFPNQYSGAARVDADRTLWSSGPSSIHGTGHFERRVGTGMKPRDNYGVGIEYRRTF